MSASRLRDMSTSFSKDIAQFEKDLAGNKAKQSKSLKELRGRLSKMAETSAASKANLEKDHAKLGEAHEQEQAEISSAEDNATKLVEEVMAEKKALKGLRQQLERKAWTASLCKNCAAQLRSLGMAQTGEVSLAREGELEEETGVGAAPDGVAHENLVRAVEALEEKRAKLQEDLMQGVLKHGADQRATLERVDALRIKENLRGATDAQTTHYLDLKSRRLENSRRAAKQYQENQLKSLTRLQADSKALKKQLQDLEATTKSCGCKL